MPKGVWGVRFWLFMSVAGLETKSVGWIRFGLFVSSARLEAEGFWWVGFRLFMTLHITGLETESIGWVWFRFFVTLGNVEASELDGCCNGNARSDKHRGQADDLGEMHVCGPVGCSWR